jgi:uncharacterized membrane protein
MAKKKNSQNSPKPSKTKKTEVKPNSFPDEVPEELKQEIVLAAKREVKTVIRQGPLPAPEDLEAYNNIIPGAAERILQMAEKEQSFVHNHTEINSKERYSGIKRAQIFALIIVFALLGTTAYLGYIGQGVPAGIVGGTSLVAVSQIIVKQWINPSDNKSDNNK